MRVRHRGDVEMLGRAVRARILFPAGPHRIQLTIQAVYRQIDRPNGIGVVRDVVARVEHAQISVRTLRIVVHGLQHSGALRDERRPGAPAGIVDVPSAVDVVQLRRPDVRLVPAAGWRRPHRHAITRDGV